MALPVVLLTKPLDLAGVVAAMEGQVAERLPDRDLGLLLRMKERVFELGGGQAFQKMSPPFSSKGEIEGRGSVTASFMRT